MKYGSLYVKPKVQLSRAKDIDRLPYLKGSFGTKQFQK